MNPAISRRLKVMLLGLGLAACTLLVYYRVGTFQFISLDDDRYVYENPHIQDGLTARGVQWAFTSSREANWHPLTWISHMLDIQLFGLRPGPHHLVNLLLHVINAILLRGFFHPPFARGIRGLDR